ncbi:MAG: site-specific integrase, partial [Actinomycetota bacterium]|nr:site-specific integrase [Actinomycetota bacterium]
TDPEPVPAQLRADPLELAIGLPLTEDEAAYVGAARAPNTLRGYRSDWSEFTSWCARHHLDPLPAAAATITGYLTELARAEAKVGTMSRRLSAIRFAHQLRDLPDPTTGARVVAVWEGIRRTHGAPPEQAAPLMPIPDNFDHASIVAEVLDVSGQRFTGCVGRWWRAGSPEPGCGHFRGGPQRCLRAVVARSGEPCGVSPRSGVAGRRTWSVGEWIDLFVDEEAVPA